MGQHSGRCDCSRSECLYRAIVDPYLTIETHYGRLLATHHVTSSRTAEQAYDS